MSRYTYWKRCDDFPTVGRLYDALVDMVGDNLEITRRTFLKHVDRENLADIEQALGYVAHHRTDHGLTMAADWAVSYHRSKFMGKTVYYFRWSSYEHIFTRKA